MSFELFTILLGGVATLAIFSFLIKENSVFRLFEHLFIGIASGLGIMLVLKNFLWPNILVPLFGLDIVVYPDGTLSKPYSYSLLLYLLPLLFGCLYYALYSVRYAWLAKLVIGFSLGMSGGASFQGIYNEITPQIIGSFKPLIVVDQGTVNWFTSFSNCVFVFTLLSVMLYFFFSFKRESAITQRSALSGRWLLMVCFGAFFGSTVMARMALLVERLGFLLHDWWGAILQLAA
jgi:hypothetical protein